MKLFAGVVLANYLLRALLAAGLALPFARVVEGAGVGRFPAGDRILFEPSGLHLLELLRLAGPELAALGLGSLRLFVIAGLLLLAARALTYAALAASPFELGGVVNRALRLLPGYLLIAGLVLLAQVLTLGLFFWLGVKVSNPFAASSEQRADLVLAAIALLGLLVSLVLGALGELARASLAHERGGGFAAVTHALELGRRCPARLLSRWAGLGATGVVVVVLAADLTALIDVSRAGAWRVVAVFGLHQLVVLALVALHTAWLSVALRAAQAPMISR